MSGQGSGAAAAVAGRPIVLVPMPLAGMKNAPSFDGKRVTEFLEIIESLGKVSGIPEAELPPFILRYCSHNLQQALRWDSVFEANDWDAAKARLTELYKGNESSASTSLNRLTTFASTASAANMVHSARSFDRYNTKFLRILGNMLKTGKISQTQTHYYFWKGLPRKLRTALRPSIERIMAGTVLSQTNPPSTSQTISAVRAYYDDEDIDYDSDSDADRRAVRKIVRLSSDEENSDSSSSDTDSDDDSARKKKKKKKSKTSSAESELSKQIQVLTQQVELLKMNHPAMSPAMQRATATTLYSQPAHQTSSMPNIPSNVPKRCYMCDGVEGVNLGHRLGIRACPETDILISEGLMMYSPQGRLVQMDGTPIPIIPSGQGGIAQYLRTKRASQTAQKGKGRDTPPHMTALAASLCRDGVELLQGSSFAVSAADVYAFPLMTRSQVKKAGAPLETGEPVRKTRMEFVHTNDDPTGENDEPTPVIRVHPPAEPTKLTPVAKDKTEPTTRIQAKPPTINTEEGWRATERVKREERANEDRDRRPAKSLPYRFTSSIQEEVSLEAVQDQILGTKITLALRDVIGMSPELQKRFSSLTKTRREIGRASATELFFQSTDDRDTGANTSRQRADASATIEVVTSVAECIQEGVSAVLTTDDESQSAALLSYDPGCEDLNEIMERYVHAIAMGPSPKKFFAMVTGIVKGKFGTEDITFLVDSGSELNLITRRVWEQSHVDLDPDGGRWSLKGVVGEPVHLFGCCRDAPVEIGGMHFDHHFFITPQETGKFDAILGQPWLQYFAARFDYARDSSSMILEVWPTGAREGKSFRTQLVGSRKHANADSLDSKVRRPAF
ncbi:hypothetical protein EUX98_g9432 [Antrodiella citrinella]|uniref:DUF4100 domain-containing protein n=1 Tax=Antrodiella citrinella TaxID=2447956 RepID=A0A4S4LT90_9APHY|nr:hypothetical protein EUX98_g9432 [Antrodiella citrinella]